MRRVLGVLAFLCLGCSGLTEQLLEAVGGGIEYADDGSIIVQMPDGSRLRTVVGADLPEGYPLPPPSEDATPSVLTYVDHADGRTAITAVYPYEITEEQVAARYDPWFTKRGGGRSDPHALEGALALQQWSMPYEGGRLEVVASRPAIGDASINLVWEKPPAADATP